MRHYGSHIFITIQPAMYNYFHATIHSPTKPYTPPPRKNYNPSQR